MHRDEIIIAVRRFLAEHRPDGIHAVESGTSLFENKTLDSLTTVAMVVFLEENFNVSLDYDDLTEENLGSLNAIADLVLRKHAVKVIP